MFNLVPLPYRILGIFFIVIGVFFWGHHAGSKAATNKYESKLSAANQAYAELEQQKNKIVEKIITQYVNKIVYVTKWRTNNVEITKTVPSDGSLNNGWVHVHDASAAGRNADPTIASDGTSSGIEANTALATVVDNYGTCTENAEKLKALQQYIRDQQKLVEEQNKND